MGFLDPYHKHPLHISQKIKKGNCFHCRLPLGFDGAYRCKPCNYYVHKFCVELPETICHPLHNEHPLTLLTLFASSPITTNLCCNKCQQPLLEGNSYHCPTCQFHLHLRCFLHLDHEKHEHPLRLCDSSGTLGVGDANCSICSYPVNNFVFSCWRCKFCIHYGCSFIPKTIKHYHVHELTIRHNFPEECDQVYCDRCEDRDGELDRGLSYYYCKRCDYIAHVLCITQPKEDAIIIKHFNHEHPLRRLTTDNILRCNECDYSVHKLEREYPSLIKHPRHPEHSVTVIEDENLIRCPDCEFTLDMYNSLIFIYPYGDLKFEFQTNNSPFVCDICGESGKGSRMVGYPSIDLHLECFALPGKLEQHESHPHHTLHLSSYIAEQDSKCRYCNVCNKEIDKLVWVYCCLVCSNYVAHVTCVAYDLLSNLRSSIKNQPDFCAIIEPDDKTFQLHAAQIGKCKGWPPKPLHMDLVKSRSNEGDDNDETKTSKDYVAEEVDGKVCCPNCNIQISIRAKDSGIGDQERNQSMTTMKEI